MKPAHPVTVIGGGLAGSEAALQLARRGVPVTLIEMRPVRSGPAHHSDLFGELVCSNSLKSDDPTSAAGALKRELTMMGSQVLEVARQCAVPAGGALAVDRDMFAVALTARITAEPLIRIERREASSLPEGRVIIATGPLTSDALEPTLIDLVGEGRLAFYDAAAPIVDASSIDRSVVFADSRYGKGGGADYLNAPMNRDEYERFVHELVDARRAIDKEFDRRELFAACQPIEEVARTGHDAIRFGALKPVGLTDPRTGNRPWAIVQLRAENRDLTAYNLVGFQTNLRWGEQERVFRLIPGLEGAEFLRFGVMHRNTFVNAPSLLDATLAVRAKPRVRLAGQLTGTEGYLEAAATGLLAALNTWAQIAGRPAVTMPREGVLGALVSYATDPATTGYQPMHVNYGLVPPLPDRVRGKRERYAAYAERALDATSALIRSRSDVFDAHDEGLHS
ncbi:MAG: methylenetetrahydrofolate--tRNA-(uracil(54)-C(5))-methyltransferase (FADH(2)-oxidizing) TrmFO [Coriobacteriia bacterium]|nr:methylenetetrahydrofolate--tRNA-(uracil(54)-C(5))-methyltransferase (FADH(2)-oxidizing) TrmFO [Coriobacteriia bacterium]